MLLALQISNARFANVSIEISFGFPILMGPSGRCFNSAILTIASTVSST